MSIAIVFRSYSKFRLIWDEVWWMVQNYFWIMIINFHKIFPSILNYFLCFLLLLLIASINKKRANLWAATAPSTSLVLWKVCQGRKNCGNFAEIFWTSGIIRKNFDQNHYFFVWQWQRFCWDLPRECLSGPASVRSIQPRHLHF